MRKTIPAAALLGILAIAAFVFVSRPALAVETETKSFVFPDAVSLKLAVPKSWRDEGVSAPSGAYPVAELSGSDPSFELKLTPQWL
jgi:hypothetical protein